MDLLIKLQKSWHSSSKIPPEAEPITEERRDRILKYFIEEGYHEAEVFKLLFISRSNEPNLFGRDNLLRIYQIARNSEADITFRSRAIGILVQYADFYRYYGSKEIQDILNYLDEGGSRLTGWLVEPNPEIRDVIRQNKVQVQRKNN